MLRCARTWLDQLVLGLSVLCPKMLCLLVPCLLLGGPAASLWAQDGAEAAADTGLLRDALPHDALPHEALPLESSQQGSLQHSNLPGYALDVRLLLEEHALEASMVLQVPKDPSRPAGELQLHLPPNRFQSSDPRGPRRALDSVPFAISYVSSARVDDLQPDGFSPGRIRIQSVQAVEEGGRDLSWELEDNPTLPRGFARAEGMMRIKDADYQGGSVRIVFRTELPHRYLDGWSEHGLFLEQWHPVLARFRDGGWIRNTAEPAPGRYSLQVQADRKGWVLAGAGLSMPVVPGEHYRVPLGDRPLRSLPLLHVAHHPESYDDGLSVELLAFQEARNLRIAHLAQDVAVELLVYLEQRYGLTLPAPQIAFVQSDAPVGDIRTIGQIVLIPETYYRNPWLIDRVFVAKLTAALAQIWFGETLWNDRDRESWLHLGVPGYISLDFFAELYGEDAGIHNITDWLRPRYREHYFEAPVRQEMRSGHDLPLDASLQHEPFRQAVRVTMHYKAPLVLRSLAHVLGRRRFHQELGRFYAENRYGTVSYRSLQRSLEAQGEPDLDWFFTDWFQHTPQLNFRIGDWSQTQQPDGRYRVELTVERHSAARMPVDVQVGTASGITQQQRWDGIAGQTTLTFVLDEPVEIIALDPDETLLELNRKDNYNTTKVRVRPIFDWAKQNEVLVALQGRAGGNAIDGNYAGLGGDVAIDENNHVEFIPIYGERTQWVNYEVLWDHSNFIYPWLSLTARAQRLGGAEFFGLSLNTNQDDIPNVELDHSIGLNRASVGKVLAVDSGRAEDQPSGQANNVVYGNELTVDHGGWITSKLALEMEHADNSTGSDFTYTTARVRLSEVVYPGLNHQITLTAQRAGTEGNAPIQKQHLLGGPKGLPGYPLELELVRENLAAFRAEYAYVFSRSIWGSLLQSRRWTALLFADVGKAWDNGDDVAASPQRQDAGFGFTMDFNLITLVEFPVRVEFAWPLNDPEYKQRRVILFEAVSFF